MAAQERRNRICVEVVLSYMARILSRGVGVTFTQRSPTHSPTMGDVRTPTVRDRGGAKPYG